MVATETEHWWLEEGEQILLHAKTTAVYQYASSPVRRKFPALYFVTDRRLVAVAKRGRVARRRILPIDIPCDRIHRCEVVTALRTPTSYFRPWFGRRVLRLDIDHQGRELVMGIVVGEHEIDGWAATLTPTAADEEPPPPPSPDPGD